MSGSHKRAFGSDLGDKLSAVDIEDGNISVSHTNIYRLPSPRQFAHLLFVSKWEAHLAIEDYSLYSISK